MKRTWIAIGIIFGVVFSGTAVVVWAGDRYSYESVRQDYAGGDGTIENRTAEADEQSLSGPIGLEEAIRIALRNNPDSLMALARIDRAEAMIDQAEAPFYPTLSFYTEYLQGDAPSAYLFKTIDQRKLEPGTDFNDPGYLGDDFMLEKDKNDPNKAKITYYPSNEDAPYIWVNITVEDGLGGIDNEEIMFTVQNINDAPKILRVAGVQPTAKKITLYATEEVTRGYVIFGPRKAAPAGAVSPSPPPFSRRKPSSSRTGDP